MNPYPSGQAPYDPNAGDLFDYKLIKHSIGYVFRSASRHRMVALMAFAAMLALTVLVAMFFPRKYKSESRLLAQRNMTMERVGNPGANPYEGTDSATRAAYETVMARKNLIEIIKQAKLIEDWEKNRNPVLGFKDKLIQVFTGPPSEDIKNDTMVEILEKRLFVVPGEGTISISVYWPNPQMARQLVDMAQQTFLEARHLAEVTALSEAISILEMHANQQQDEIKWAMQSVDKVVDEKRKGRSSSVRNELTPAAAEQRKPASEGGGRSTSGVELQQLRSVIRARRVQYEDLESFRERRVRELQDNLTEQRAVYSASHPNILDLQQRVQAMKKESPQASALKQELAQLLAQYRSLGGTDVDGELSTTSRGVRPAVASVDAILSTSFSGLEDDPSVVVARDQLRMAIGRYQDLQMRLDQARVELDTARAAFKYRYSVVSPALTPRRPESPNTVIIVLAGVIVSIFGAFFAAVMVDLSRGLLIESWEVPSRLGLNVLAEVKG